MTLLHFQFASYEEPQEEDEPYIAASFKAAHVPYLFTVGDGEEYGGFKNGRLLSGEYYAMYMAGIVHAKNGVSSECPLKPKQFNFDCLICTGAVLKM